MMEMPEAITPDEREVLARRTRELARPLEQDRAAERKLRIVEFRLGTERYALEMDYVLEILPMLQWTALPCVPPFVMGLLNVRGQIFSIVDLRVIFGIASGAGDATKNVILLRHGEMRFGIFAEAIDGVRAVEAGQLQPPLATLHPRAARFVMAMMPGGSSLLSARKLLEDPDMIVNEL